MSESRRRPADPRVEVRPGVCGAAAVSWVGKRGRAVKLTLRMEMVSTAEVGGGGVAALGEQSGGVAHLWEPHEELSPHVRGTKRHLPPKVFLMGFIFEAQLLRNLILPLAVARVRHHRCRAWAERCW